MNIYLIRVQQEQLLILTLKSFAKYYLECQFYNYTNSHLKTKENVIKINAELIFLGNDFKVALFADFNIHRNIHIQF